MTNFIERNDRTLSPVIIDPQNSGFLTGIIGQNVFGYDGFDALFPDAFTDPNNTKVDIVLFAGDSGIPIENIGFTVSFIYANKNKQIFQKTTLQQGEFLRDHVAIGIINHAADGTITSISSPTQTTSVSAQMGFADMSTAMAPINATQGDRNVVSGRAGTLELNKTSGLWYNHALNARNTSKNPSFVFSPAFTGVILFIAWRSVGSPDGFKRIIQNPLLTLYDDGTATDADALPQGVLGDYEWVNHRVYEAVNEAASGNPPLFAVQLGQQKYSSKFAAIHGMKSEVYDTFDTFKGAPALATVTIRGGATDLNDPCDRDIRQAVPARSEFQ